MRDLHKKVLEDAKALHDVAIESAKNTLLEQFNPAIEESVANAINGAAGLEMEAAVEDDVPVETEEDGEMKEIDLSLGGNGFGAPGNSGLGEMAYEAKDEGGEDAEMDIKIDDLKDDGEEPKEESLEITKEEYRRAWEDLKMEVQVSKGFKDLANPNTEGGNAGLSSQKSGESQWADVTPPDAEDHTVKEALVREIKKYQKALEIATHKLAESKKVINTLHKNIQEATLFNHKLLYVNKLTRQPGLDVSFKEQMVEAMDKANTLTEAKLVYETYKSAISNLLKNGKNMNESRKIAKSGSASRVAGKSATLLTEGAESSNDRAEKARYKLLAGISE